jgi:hypothetical protein
MLLLPQVHYVQAEDATGTPYVQDSMAELPVSILTFLFSVMDLISKIFVSRSGIGRSGRLQSSHTRLAGVLGGVTWSVNQSVALCHIF